MQGTIHQSRENIKVVVVFKCPSDMGFEKTNGNITSTVSTTLVLEIVAPETARPLRP